MNHPILLEVESGKKAFYTDGYAMSIGELVSMYKEGELIIRKFGTKSKRCYAQSRSIENKFYK